jgi:predicted CopG family antitoxin
MINKNTHGFDNDFRMGKVGGDSIYLRAPAWDCGWYWGFGYLGNKDCHYHLDGLDKNKNLFDAIKAHFGDSLTITDEKDLWSFCELIATFYSLKETAEVLGRGGSHYTNNPVSNIIKNEAEAKRINDIVLPSIFEALQAILKKY